MPALEIQLVLIVIAFLAGVGITAIGPGGIFLTIALYALAPLTAQEVAGTASGMLGVGGPVLMVPALVVVGVPILLAVAVSQVQSVFIAGFATLGYLLHGAVLWPMALLVGVPQLAGAALGWRVAHRIDPARLRVALGLALLVIAPILAF